MLPYHGYGFPSGHVFFAVMFLGILTYLFFNHFQNNFWRVTVIVIGILIILCISFARIYLGLHWASDVLGGLVYGGLFLCLLIGLAPSTKFSK
jgi:undecaprenyl-diphosphatase